MQQSGWRDVEIAGVRTRTFMIGGCPSAIIDQDYRGMDILRIPRVYAFIHNVEIGALTRNQLDRMGKHVASRIRNRGFCQIVKDGNVISIKRYEPDQFPELAHVLFDYYV